MGYFRIYTLFFVLFPSLIALAKPVNLIAQSARSPKRVESQSFLVFPEVREKPLKWYDTLTTAEMNYALHPHDFVMKAQPGEYYVYQLGVKALGQDISNLQIEFSYLKGDNGKEIKASRMSCFNKGGIDFKGNPFSKRMDIAKGRLQALWISVDLEGVEEGNYRGTVSITAQGQEKILPLLLRVNGPAVINHGFNEGSRLARLNWLNTTRGIDGRITKGFTPIKVVKNQVSILGRTLTIADNGLPASILSFFSPSNQSLVERGAPVVGQPFRFVIEKGNGEVVRLIPGPLKFTKKTSSAVSWRVVNQSEEFALACTGTMEFDGFVDYRLKLTAKRNIDVKDIRLEVPVVKENAEYLMGLGQEGGIRPAQLQWKWDTTKNQDMLWLGAVNGGVRIKWKDENYVRPLVNIYYKFGPLRMPPSWGNNGLGGVSVSEQNKNVAVNAYSGKRALKNGKILNYDFELLITPFKVMDKNVLFGDRYYQGGGRNSSVKIADAKKAGANILTVHQADDIYPFINYPYLDDNREALTKLATAAHDADMRLKVYYTTRELTKNLPEFWALNSLNGEVIFPGPGNAARTAELHPNGPSEWLVKNVREKYIPAWYDTIKYGKFKGDVDLSVITTPDSRLNNFYIGGLDWMVKNIGIDGVYIDDSALDRFTLRRARKVIDLYRPAGRIDMHSWNHFNKSAGFASCLNLYMDLLPYLDQVWIGEARNYDRLPDHWLIEVSGIPFGLPGQMLEGGGNPWRGMVYGITTRAGWTPNPPTETWKFWDEHKLKEKTMIGYWEKECPVSSNNPLIKATVYKGNDESVISVGNWSADDQNVSFKVDWLKLGIDPGQSEISIPAIKDFQQEQKNISLDQITVPGKKGYLILVKKK